MLSPKLMKKQAARAEREARKNQFKLPQQAVNELKRMIKQNPEKFEHLATVKVAPFSNKVPAELQSLHAAVLTWVMNEFSNYETFKNGIDGLRDDYGVGMGIAEGLTQLFVCRGLSDIAQMLSMRNFSIDNPNAEPVPVTINEAIADMQRTIEQYGMQEAVKMCVTYKCYEPWETVFEIAQNTYENITPERFGMLVKFIYDGYSA
jgi:hypothetical protein